jgi:hypothetical protein
MTATTPQPTPDLGALRDLLARATRLPWRAEDFAKAPATDTQPALHTMKLRPVQHTVLGSLSPDDAALIVAAVNALPYLLDQAERVGRYEYLLRRAKGLAFSACGEVECDCEEKCIIDDIGAALQDIAP